MHHILFYDYVADVVERRGPFREAHLARIRAHHERGTIVMAGALGDPPRGAAIVFGPSAGLAEVETFAAGDPYVQNGLVKDRRIEPWAVVA